MNEVFLEVSTFQLKTLVCLIEQSPMYTPLQIQWFHDLLSLSYLYQLTRGNENLEIKMSMPLLRPICMMKEQGNINPNMEWKWKLFKRKLLTKWSHCDFPDTLAQLFVDFIDLLWWSIIMFILIFRI